jgi:hypothetical protein
VLEGAGFIRATVDDRAEMTVDDARAALVAIRSLGEGQRRPTLVDMRAVKAITREGRDHFRDASAVECTRVALLVASPVGRVIGNFFLRTQISGMPTKIFDDEDAAIGWLLAESR